MKLDERMKVTRGLIWQINTYQDILEYLSYGLNDSPNPIGQNEGLFFLWNSLIGLQILALSIIIKDDGAFSLKKLINIGGARIKGFDKSGLMKEFDYIHSEYQRHKLDCVRDQFIAHLDMSVEEIKTDIRMLCFARNQVTSLYGRISLAAGGDEYEHDDICVKEIRSIFDEIDEYEKVKAIIVSAQIKGLKQVHVSDFLAIKFKR